MYLCYLILAGIQPYKFVGITGRMLCTICQNSLLATPLTPERMVDSICSVLCMVS